MFNLEKNNEKTNSPKKTYNIFNFFPKDKDNDADKYSNDPPEKDSCFSSPHQKKIIYMTIIIKKKIVIIKTIIIYTVHMLRE